MEYSPLATFVIDACPLSSVRTYFVAVVAPLGVRDAVAKATGSPVLSSISFSLTDYCACAERGRAIKRIDTANTVLKKRSKRFLSII